MALVGASPSLVFGEKTNRPELPRAPAPAPRRRPHPHAEAQRLSWRPGRLCNLCLIRLQTGKRSEKTTLDWVGPSPLELQPWQPYPAATVLFTVLQAYSGVLLLESLIC